MTRFIFRLRSRNTWALSGKSVGGPRTIKGHRVMSPGTVATPPANAAETVCFLESKDLLGTEASPHADGKRLSAEHDRGTSLDAALDSKLARCDTWIEFYTGIKTISDYNGRLGVPEAMSEKPASSKRVD